MMHDRIFKGYDVVDNEYFSGKAEELRSQESEVRQKYRLPETYFLASARFVEKKNLSKLIEAYAEYRRASEMTGYVPWDLVLLGDGPLREALNSQLSTLNLHQHVHV